MTDHPQPALKHPTQVEVHLTVVLRCCLLGGFRIQRGEKTLMGECIRLRKARDLLKLLALAPDHRIHREQLLEMLWPEHNPEDAAHSLNQTLYKLRPKLTELDPSAQILLRDDCLIFTADNGVTTDVEEFEQAARQALSQIDPLNSQAAATCQVAILAYSGDLLPEDGPSDLYYQRRDELRQFYISLLVKLADYNLEMEEYLPAIDALQKATTADPLHEEAHTRLMRAYALSGRRQAALRQYQVLEGALRRDLDVEPAPESQALREQITSGELAARLPMLEGLLVPHHNLPAQMSSFIGRESELIEIGDLVKANRLVTLTGAGGVGKTRLALKTAESLLDDFAQGVFWVELASLSNPEMVAQGVLEVFRLPEVEGLSDTQRLVDFLKERSLLLLMDNCEHLLSGCTALVTALLKACPDLHILATSRVRLNLPGEVTYRVPSLAVPDPAQLGSLPELSQFAAVRLFTERAGSYAQGFSLTRVNAPVVAHICQRLDGIPLALELAAARSRMMTVEQIAERLGDAFRLLVGGSQAVLPRHRTLRASIEWSCDMLPRKEALLLQRLSVFAGGWELEAAEEVCQDEDLKQTEVLDLLASLVDHSLVFVENQPEGEARYRMLETVRQYAHERLEEGAGVNEIHWQHLAYFLRLAEQADIEIRGPQQMIGFNRLERERGNITSALERSFSSEATAEMGIHLVCALCWSWGMVGDFIIGKYWLERALSWSTKLGRTATRANILYQAGFFSILGSSWLERHIAWGLLQESLEIYRELGSDFTLEQAQCRLTLGFAQYSYCNNKQRLLADMYESMNTFQDLGSTWWQAWALNLISGVLVQYEDPQTIKYLFQEEAALWEKTGDRFLQAMPIQDWGRFALKHGYFNEAQEYLQRSLKIYKEFRGKGWIFQVLRDLGHAARGLRDYDLAEAYYLNGESLAKELGYSKKVTPIHYGLGYIALHKNEDARAEKYFRQSLRRSQEYDLKYGLILCLACFAALNVVREKSAAATRLFGAFSAQIEANQMQLNQDDRIEIDEYLALCRAQIDEASFDHAWNAGCAMSLEQAVAFALEPVV